MPIARSNVGFAVNVSYHDNSIDNITIARQLTASSNNGYTYTLEADDYKLYNFMGGVYVTLPVKRFSVDFKGLAGTSLLTYPKQTVTAFSGGVADAVSSEPTTSAAFSYAGNVTIRFKVKSHFCVLLQTGMIHTMPHYFGKFHEPSGAVSSSFNGDQPITILHVAGGIGFQF